jgi:hypothetical protein
MIRVPVKTMKGRYRIMRTRLPNTRTFDLYRTAETDAPDLLEQIYAGISRDFELHSDERVHRSTGLLDRVPADAAYRDRWLKFSESEAERRSLFEQVLWAFFFDRPEMWETTWPEKGVTGAEYTRESASATVAAEARQAPKKAKVRPAPKKAALAPKSPRRSFAPKAAAQSRDGGAAPPVAKGATAPLKAGDTVEIVNHAFAGKTGVVVALEDDDGLNLVTIRMQVAGLFKDVSGFLLSQVRKI